MTAVDQINQNLESSEGLKTLLAEGSVREATADEIFARTDLQYMMSPSLVASLLAKALPKKTLVPTAIMLKNEALRNVDVKAKDLTAEIQAQVLEECRTNPAYFFHFVVSTPTR